MYIYTAYDLVINSEILLPELEPVEDKSTADITLKISQSKTLDSIKTDRGQSFVGEIAGVCEFAVQNGKEISLVPAPGVGEPILRPLILGPIISILLRQRGLLVLHASCISIDGSAVAFLGFSGSGKSTLAEFFHSQGYPVLTDDVMAVDTQQNPPLVISGFPQIKLWSEAATVVGHDPQKLPKLHHLSEKLVHRLDSGFLPTNLPLKRIYVLDRGESHQISKLGTQEAFAELIRHCRAISLLTHQSLISSHFNQSSALIGKVSICRLQRKMSLELLPELLNLIKEDLTQTAESYNPLSDRSPMLSSN